VKYIIGLPTDDVAHREEFATVDALAEIAPTIEALGYEGVYVTDHPMPPARFIETGGHHALEPTVALAVVGALTSSLRLMTNLYILAYRNPFLAAKAIATLDSLTGGRVILGTGAGYLEPEFHALGADFAARNDRLDETIDLMRETWTGEVVHASGPEFDAPGHVALPTPVQQPGPPIWIGGNAPRAMRRAAARGDGWIPMPAPAKFAQRVRTAPLESLDDLRRMLGTLHEEAERAGRTTPLDVNFGPMGVGYYGSDGFEASAYVDQVGELTEMGVTYAGVSFEHPGSGTVTTRAHFLDLAGGFAETIGISQSS
jgi:probable F420-dependent oxidoreductase